MKDFCLKYIIIACCILLTACNQEETGMQDDKYSASLTVSFALSDMVQSRGLEDLDDDKTVEEWEKVVDGRMIYNLAVFLVQNNQIKHRQIINVESFNTAKNQATVTFTNLNHGNYTLLAVANYNNYSSEYQGALQLNADNITAENLLNTVISSSSSSQLCNKKTPYPLTMKKDIVLQPGHNSVEGELVRTNARLRIIVRNQSKVADLQVTSLSLSEKFTQSSVNLFDEDGNAYASIKISDADAIIPFAIQNSIINKVTDENVVTEKVIFDGYLLESTNINGYNYTINVACKGASQAKTIPISIIDKETGEAIPLKSIKRNDLINVLISVSYNDKYGDFLFSVNSWFDKENEIEFN